MNYPSYQHFNTRQQAEDKKAEMEQDGFEVSKVKLQFDGKGLRPRKNGFYIEINW